MSSPDKHQFLILLKLPSDSNTNHIKTESRKRFRYHQKYHLQQHTYLCSVLDLDDSEGPLLRQSHLAARLNGFLAGFGSLPQIEKEGPKLGLDEKTMDYVRRFFIEYQGQGLTCQFFTERIYLQIQHLGDRKTSLVNSSITLSHLDKCNLNSS